MFDFRICGCCLSTESKELILGNSYADILDIVTKKELDTSALMLCYRCRHRVRQISQFRAVCLQAQNAMKECSTLCTDNQIEYLKRERKKLPKCNELTFSNILCLDIQIKEQKSHVELISIPRNSNTEINYTENTMDKEMKYTEITTDKEINYKENILDKEMNYSENTIDKKMIKLETTNFFKFESDVKEFQNIEFEMETNDSDDFSNLIDDETILDYPFKEKSHRKKKIGPRKLSVKNEMIEKTTTIVTRNKCDKKGEIFSPTKCKKGERLIEDGKASEVSLTLTEQLQEKRNKAKQQDYISSPYKCDQCIVTFKYEHILEKHMNKHKESAGAFSCPVCRLRFKKSDRLYEHRKIHATRLLCLACGASYSKRSRLREHLRWHAGETLTCGDCQKTFRHKSTLRYHLSVHHRKGEYHCDLCTEVFQYQVELGKHQMLHLKSSRAHACSVCDKTFCTLEALGAHGTTHGATEPAQHYCVECDLHFKTPITLQVHLTHSVRHRDPSTLKFECASCPRRLPSASQLAKHVREIHERVTCNACETCGLGFSSWRRLYVHRRKVHLGYKPARKYICQLCHKAFQSKSVLDRHAVTHTGARPHPCNLCHNAFTQRSALATHVKLVHLKIKRNKTTGRNADNGNCSAENT